MRACIAHLLDLEELSQELLGHSPNDFIQEQVLVDGIEVSLCSETSSLDVLTDNFDVL